MPAINREYSAFGIGEVQKIAKAIASANWNMSYQAFCALLGRAPDCYTEEKWMAFKSISTGFASLGAENLLPILNEFPPENS